MQGCLLGSAPASAVCRALRGSSVCLVSAMASGLMMAAPAGAQTVSNTAAVSLLSPFDNLPVNTFQASLQVTISVNNAATPAQSAVAYMDGVNQYPTITPGQFSTNTGTAQLSNGLGLKASAVLSGLTYSTTASVNTSLLSSLVRYTFIFVQTDLVYAKRYFGAQHIADQAYGVTSAAGSPWPYSVAPSQIHLYTSSDTPTAPYGLPGSASDSTGTPSFPSGNSVSGYIYGLIDAIMVPERYQQSLTRASDYANNRLVLGVHYALDLIGGRIVATEDLANMLNNTPGYTGVTVGGVAIPADYASAFSQATASFLVPLQAACGSQSINSCVNNNPGDQFSDGALNKANYTYRLTYGLAPVGPTDLAPVVPAGAQILLATRFPYLSDVQRTEVLYTTELPSGYPLDDGSGWARLNLYAAAGGYGMLRNDVTVTMDASQGGLNASDSWNNDMTGSGRLIKAGTGTLTLSGNNRVGGIWVQGGTLALTGSDTFSGASRVETGATLAMAIDGNTPGQGPGTYTRITGTGSATFLAGGVLRPLMGSALATTSGYTAPAVGSSYTLVSTATNGVSGRFASLAPSAATQSQLAPNTAFALAYYPNAIVLYVTPTSYTSAANAASLGDNQKVVAQVIDLVGAATNRGLTADNSTSALLGAVGGLSTGGLRAGLNQVSGVGILNHASSSQTASHAFTRTVGNRLSQLHAGATSIAERASSGLFAFNVASAGGDGPGGDGIGTVTMSDADTGMSAAKSLGLSSWAQGVGVFSNNSGDGNAPGFRGTVAGGVAGVDYRLTDTFVLGGNFGYARSDVTARDSAGNTTGDNYQIAAYGGWTPGTFFVDAALGYTFSEYQSQRNISMSNYSGTAKGSTSGGDFGISTRAGKRFDVAGYHLEPDLGLSYDRVNTASFQETGAGSFNLTVGGTAIDSLRSSLGGRIYRTFQVNDGLRLEPEVRAHWEHEYMDLGARTSVSLVGQPMTITGTQAAGDAAVLGIGLAGLVNEKTRLYVTYDASLRENQTDHAITAGTKITW
ncbi:MAG: autotransporter domain-containing protein [Alphaproteobacteria bacterium]|nr:autotransporter domain-containing protein [Alphaproteobacteria bacterium]